MLSPRLGFGEQAEWGTWGPYRWLGTGTGPVGKWACAVSRTYRASGLSKRAVSDPRLLGGQGLRPMGGQISRSEHVTELTPLVRFAFPSAPSLRPFGDTSPMTGKGLGGYGGRSCCRRMRLESGTTSVWSGLSPGSQRARGGRQRRRTCPA